MLERVYPFTCHDRVWISIEKPMNCPDHGKQRGYLDKKSGFPLCGICSKELHCPDDRVQCPHAPSWGGGPPSYDYCIQCEEI